MKGFWAIIVRELRDKRTLLIGALALGVVPWIAPFFPGLSRFKTEDVRGAFMILLGLSLPPALGLGLGASVVGEEVAGRRLGFYFARPLAAWAIWGGKMVVALLLPLVAAVLIFTPGAAVLRGDVPVGPVVGSLAISVLLCAVAHVAAGLYRTRSPWLALDLALATFVVGGFYFVGWQAVDSGARDLAVRAGPWLALAVVVIALSAGLAQVAQGRGDPVRGHLALAVVLWGGLLVCLGGASGLTAWYLSPAPADLRGRTVLPIGDGDHFLLSAFGSRGRDFFAPWFALDVREGRGQKVAANLAPAAVSPGGRHVALIEGAISPRLVLVSAVAGQLPVVTRISLDEGREAWPLCLSDDGALIVLKYAAFAQIVDTATGKVRPGPRLEADACSFEGRVRAALYRRDVAAGSLDLSLFDLASGRSGEVVRFAGADRPLAVRGDRLLARMGGPGLSEVGLFDAGTGRLIGSLGRMTMGRSPGALLLRDRRTAIMSPGDVDSILRLFDAEGHELWATKVGDRGRAALVGETETGEIVAVSWSAKLVPTTLYLDGASGAIARSLEGLFPAGGLPLFGASDPTLDLSGPRIESRLFLDKTEALYRVDPANGQKRLLVPGQAEMTAAEIGF